MWSMTTIRKLAIGAGLRTPLSTASHLFRCFLSKDFLVEYFFMRMLFSKKLV